jgi:hypothetical protein
VKFSGNSLDLSGTTYVNCYITRKFVITDQPNIVGLMKNWWLLWVGNRPVNRMERQEMLTIFLWENFLERKSLGKGRKRQDYNIRLNFTEI